MVVLVNHNSIARNYHLLCCLLEAGEKLLVKLETHKNNRIERFILGRGSDARLPITKTKSLNNLISAEALVRLKSR